MQVSATFTTFEELPLVREFFAHSAAPGAQADTAAALAAFTTRMETFMAQLLDDVAALRVDFGALKDARTADAAKVAELTAKLATANDAIQADEAASADLKAQVAAAHEAAQALHADMQTAPTPAPAPEPAPTPAPAPVVGTPVATVQPAPEPAPSLTLDATPAPLPSGLA